ncbi:MAG: ribosome assembly RNA-binding protein YhbY [Gemmatimonadota bacterium]|nr:ribosome assembly RNA-binding protein YhbY [Gemmatimonadota bacterium]MDH5761066.1 ribosome assembly RNA-binding protein YhbY [Gemmatimonadota bacterium]
MSPQSITSKQRAHLRSLAHHLKPVVQIGAAGVNETNLAGVREAFNTRELLKVKVLESAPEKARTTADQIVAAMEEVHVVQTIGRTVVLYRPFPDEPEIKLPR